MRRRPLSRQHAKSVDARAAKYSLARADDKQPAALQGASVNSHTVANQHDAYPRASGRGQGLRRGNPLNWRLRPGAWHTVRQVARAYIDTVMSEKTGVHPVADNAVTPRITATVILLVMPDITHSIRPDCARLNLEPGPWRQEAQERPLPTPNNK